MQRNEPLIFNTDNKTVIVDFDFLQMTFEKSALNHNLLNNCIETVNELVTKIETQIKPQIYDINKDTKYRKISLYITLFLLLLIFIFAIVGGATELYYFFYIAMGIFFIKTTTFTIINFAYMNPKFNESLISMKMNCKKIIDDFNKKDDLNNNKIVCGFNYARVVNEKIKVTFYKRIKVYLIFYQNNNNYEADIDDFESAHFQMEV